jgi:hypothetical protein
MVPIEKIGGRLGNQMFRLAYVYAEARIGNIPDMYVQDPYYFQEYEKEIKALFGQGIEPVDQVAIHVRRGDYVKNPFYVDLTDTDYYEKAMALFPTEKFIVFSDNVEWCKEQPIFKDCDFSEGNDEITDLNLMAGCKHQIIANSSFSWWAGYLNPNPNKKVVYPSRWYMDGAERTVCPETWIKI